MENNYRTIYKLYVDESKNTYSFTSKKLLIEYLEDRYCIAHRQISIVENPNEVNKVVNVLDKFGNIIRPIGFVYEINE